MPASTAQCSAHIPAGTQCKRAASHITATGRRYCSQHAAQLNTGRATVRPLARRISLGWAQATNATGAPVSDTWHGFEESGFEEGQGRSSLCGQVYPFIGPRRLIKPPFDAGDDSVCYYCRLTLVRRDIELRAAAIAFGAQVAAIRAKGNR